MLLLSCFYDELARKQNFEFFFYFQANLNLLLSKSFEIIYGSKYKGFKDNDVQQQLLNTFVQIKCIFFSVSVIFVVISWSLKCSLENV